MMSRNTGLMNAARAVLLNACLLLVSCSSTTPPLMPLQDQALPLLPAGLAIRPQPLPPWRQATRLRRYPTRHPRPQHRRRRTLPAACRAGKWPAGLPRCTTEQEGIMKIEVEFWQLVGLLLGFLGFVFAAGKILLAQIEQRLNERFGALEQARSQSEKGWQRLKRALTEPSFSGYAELESLLHGYAVRRIT
ncbi:hypothetical protein GMW71_14160 [Pectobacterium brasiliense]|nr:hypothetical protein GMW71_14160 [Pectobacterium brasiliense]